MSHPFRQHSAARQVPLSPQDPLSGPFSLSPTSHPAHSSSETCKGYRE